MSIEFEIYKITEKECEEIINQLNSIRQSFDSFFVDLHQDNIFKIVKSSNMTTYNRLNQFHYKIIKDFFCSIFLCKTGYYRQANGILRNILENIFRLVYFIYYPKEFHSFSSPNNWVTINRRSLSTLKSKNASLADEFKRLGNKFSKDVHTVPDSPILKKDFQLEYSRDKVEKFRDNCNELKALSETIRKYL